MVINKTTKAVPDPDVIFRHLDNGDAVLHHRRTSQYFSLNFTGAQIWQLLTDGRSVGEIADVLAQHFDISPDRAFESASRFVQQMVREDLLMIHWRNGSPVH